MAWSLALIDADSLDAPEDVVEALKLEYPAEIGGIPDRFIEFIHDYDQVPVETIEEILGPEVAEYNHVFGLYKDMDLKRVGDRRNGYLLFSITRMKHALEHRFPSIVEHFAGHSSLVEDIESGKIAVPSNEIGKWRLIASVIQAALNPVRGHPIVAFFW